MAILAVSAVSAGNVDAERLEWHVDGAPVGAGAAQHSHARVLLELERRGEPIDDQAKAVAVALGG